MTETSARVLLDSISPQGARLTTMEVTFHRFILAEFNTHRAFSRNSASSRAIPVSAQLKKFREDPAYFSSWQAESSGMVGTDELQNKDLEDARALDQRIRDFISHELEQYVGARSQQHRLRKSRLNRYMEFGQWHTAIVSSTEWENFFDQRAASRTDQAEPEMLILGQRMLEALEASVPTEPYLGWHTPLVLPDEMTSLLLKPRLKISAARCARVSYLTHEGLRDTEEDLAMFGRLMGAAPRHHSPTEHVATPCPPMGHTHLGNFDGWDQLRHRPGVLE